MGSFLQTMEWEEIQRRMGRATRRIDGVLYIRHELPLGMSYWYAPRPPMGAAESIGAAAEAALGEGAAFLRIEAAEAIAPPNGRHVNPAANMQPVETVIIDVSRSDAALLGAMHPKTRYNIRLAERHGVIIRRESGDDAVRRFQDLIRHTAARDGFHPHPLDHYAKLLAVRSPQFSNELLFAYLGDRPVAAAMVNWCGSRATYLHGASDYAMRQCMAPHLVQWEAMRGARDGGCDVYDLWGIDDERWPGISRFKRGFGGAIVRYPAALDIVLSRPRYALYQLQRRLRGRPVRVLDREYGTSPVNVNP